VAGKKLCVKLCFFSVSSYVSTPGQCYAKQTSECTFFGREGYVFMFICEKNYACGHGLKKNIVSHIVSFPPLNYPPFVLAVLLVVVLVVVLLSCCCRCLHLLCCRVANTAATATIVTPPLPPPPPPPLVGEQDDACYTDANSSPATSAQGGTNGGGRSSIAHRIGMVLPSPTQGGATATRVVGE
jgi:hypothetical protein